MSLGYGHDVEKSQITLVFGNFVAGYFATHYLGKNRSHSVYRFGLG
jgi:hypothetical protein